MRTKLYPEYSTEFISQMMHLRKPQKDSLFLLEQLMELAELSKDTDMESLLKQVQKICPTCVDFERNFVSMAFALATGVGKTKLMGAFISYLYANFGIQNFMVIAPNLTIYNKLIEDFSDTTSPKYVFSGIDVFIHKEPTIITGDNYKDRSFGQISLGDSVYINIFNIGKINAEVRGGKTPLIKRLSEYIGTSYFNYLSDCKDLVMLMDESHHYRADRGMAVLNELSPMLGLELTATPMVEIGGKKKPFKNVVYEYSLAKAIVDGYVKEPAAATRENLDPKNYTPKALEELKIKDGIKLHRATKAELELYAARERVKKIKPFVLIVCRDTTHAAEVKDYISTKLYDGFYEDKTIIVHSNLSGAEKEENITQLLSLEKEENKIEIVIHVNMLKEGWDVTNLYTIIPLRAVTSDVLLEQTLGRGLRLPYGQRTGNEFVDRVTVVAHDRFDRLIEDASKETSIIRANNIIKLEDLDIDNEKEVVTSLTVHEAYLQSLSDELGEDEAESYIEAKKVELKIAKIADKVVNEMLTTPVAKNGGLGVVATQDIASDAMRQIIVSKVQEEIGRDNNVSLDAVSNEMVERVLSPYLQVRINNTIDIPDIAFVPKGGINYEFVEFDLNTKSMNYSPTKEKIFIKRLRDEDVSTFDAEARVVVDNAEQEILNQLLTSNRVIYNSITNKFIFKLIRQALKHVRLSVETENDYKNVVFNYKKAIAKEIENQMFCTEHFKLSEPEYNIRLIRAVSDLIKPNYSKYREDDLKRLYDNVSASDLKITVFAGTSKSIFDKVKFDSLPEKEFAMIIDRKDNSIIKWMRPAPKQFKIFWQGTREYEPDFIVETIDTIYMIEIKAINMTEDAEVKLKARAALRYCENINNCPSLKLEKKWKYVVVEDSVISKNSTFDKIVSNNKQY